MNSRRRVASDARHSVEVSMGGVELFQKHCAKTGLNEVMIATECVCEMLIAHDDERDAVG